VGRIVMGAYDYPAGGIHDDFVDHRTECQEMQAKLDLAHKILTTYEGEIESKLRDIGYPAHVVGWVEKALEDLVSGTGEGRSR
jgi:hypothetical protein